MDKFIMIDGKEIEIQQENSESYELVTYAPDGEGTRFIIPKMNCFMDDGGKLHADRFEIDAHYR